MAHQAAVMPVQRAPCRERGPGHVDRWPPIIPAIASAALGSRSSHWLCTSAWILDGAIGLWHMHAGRFATEQWCSRSKGIFIGQASTSPDVRCSGVRARSHARESLRSMVVPTTRSPDMDSVAKRIVDIGPKPQAFDIERATKENSDYRSVAWSGRYLQVTLMSIPAGRSVGLEAHPQTDQFLRLDAGGGRVQMGATKDDLTFEREVSDGWCVLVPAGTWHNITNTGTTPMKVYTIYAPAHHAPGKVQATSAAAEADKDDEPAAWSVQTQSASDQHG